jgi:hypothetical protein
MLLVDPDLSLGMLKLTSVLPCTLCIASYLTSFSKQRNELCANLGEAVPITLNLA